MQSEYEIWNLIYTNCPPYSVKKRFHFFFNKPEEKPGEGEQREEAESELAEVTSQAEESPPSIPTEDKEPPQNQENLKEDIHPETQQDVCQPSPTRTHSGRGRPPKATPLSAQKKISVKTEEESAAQDVPGFQDDPSDADYTPSKCIFICILMFTSQVLKLEVHVMHYSVSVSVLIF